MVVRGWPCRVAAAVSESPFSCFPLRQAWPDQAVAMVLPAKLRIIPALFWDARAIVA